ncbi:MAG: hypothetical protein IPJ89_00230 [Candidatus Iainarchaeum archaeon]|uniref:Uncharacterized protein n=1 Tax=Candidatus Iainarchaeum sp. TaxID=3101447 RepID=A0A7T9I1Q7_9ARCH|nr:MAG: hypothetical protein IPJ89_00230 [Candidatus Diapherotrites archaeon]
MPAQSNTADASTPSSGEPSIIEIIRNMVAEGESEEAILQTLAQLGIDQKKSQRLLLLAQADTFALLRSEIGKVVKQEIETQKNDMRSFMQTEAKSSVEGLRGALTQSVKQDLVAYENQITNQSRSFQSQISDTVQKFTELSERVRITLNTLGKDVQQIKADQDELRLKGISSKNRIISTIVLIIGILFVLADLALFVLNFGSALTIDSVIIFIVMALVGVTMMFVATLV